MNSVSVAQHTSREHTRTGLSVAHLKRAFIDNLIYEQGKYPEALKYADQAVQLTQESTTVGSAARNERSRLQQLTGGGNASPAAKPPAGAGNGEAPKQ